MMLRRLVMENHVKLMGLPYVRSVEPAREGPNLACEISKKSQWSLNLLAMLANIPINFILEISETAVSWESCDC
jgi:hypothetical protein